MDRRARDPLHDGPVACELPLRPLRCRARKADYRKLAEVAEPGGGVVSRAGRPRLPWAAPAVPLRAAPAVPLRAPAAARRGGFRFVRPPARTSRAARPE